MRSNQSCSYLYRSSAFRYKNASSFGYVEWLAQSLVFYYGNQPMELPSQWLGQIIGQLKLNVTLSKRPSTEASAISFPWEHETG